MSTAMGINLSAIEDPKALHRSSSDRKRPGCTEDTNSEDSSPNFAVTQALVSLLAQPGGTNMDAKLRRLKSEEFKGELLMSLISIMVECI